MEADTLTTIITGGLFLLGLVGLVVDLHRRTTSKFEARFDKFEEKLDGLEDHLDEKIIALYDRSSSRTKTLEKIVQENETRTKIIMERLSHIEEDIKDLKNDRQGLGTS